MPKLPPLIRWTRASTVLLSAFLMVIGLIIYVWWPLAQDYLSYIDWHGAWWRYIDWLLIGIFLFMSLTIVARANLRRDGLIVLVATIGGLVIEAWGTQTNLWFYYTSERPPLWIVPAWPIATLCIDRITRVLDYLTTKYTKEHKGKDIVPEFLTTKDTEEHEGRDNASAIGLPHPHPSPLGRGGIGKRIFKTLYWLTFVLFLGLMLSFVAPTFNKPYTILALLLCGLLILTPTDHRLTLLVFVAGAGLGYFLELWGTTRECWTYYTHQTPPLFAVLAHGMAAVAFWRTGLILKMLGRRFGLLRPQSVRVEREA